MIDRSGRPAVRQAVVLAGGMGARLGKLTSGTPKPMLPVAGRPFLAYLLDWLALSGIEEIVVSTGYLPDAFGGLLNSLDLRDPVGEMIHVREARETVRAGTAGALALMANELESRFLVVNGDTLFYCDLPAVIGASDRLPTGDMLLAVHAVPEVSRYGGVEMGPDGRVLHFSEKGQSGPGLINAGVSILDRSMIDLVDAVPCSLERDIYPRLASAGRLHAIEQQGYFIDIGLPATYSRAQSELAALRARPAAFFDRDGVLNADCGYTHRPEDLVFVEGAVEALRMARAAGYLTVVVTNQAGIAKGRYDEAAVKGFHSHMNAQLRAQGAWIDAFYFCPYHPDGSVAIYRRVHPDRKPEPGMILRAIDDLSIDPARSFLIGDKETDIEAARRAGIEGYLYSTGGVDRIVAQALASLEKRSQKSSSVRPTTLLRSRS